MKAETFQRLNGFSNMFWGWGGEDDEMYRRCRRSRADVYIYRPKGDIVPSNSADSASTEGCAAAAAGGAVYEDLEKFTLQEKLDILRKHANEWKCMEKKEILQLQEKLWPRDGLSNLDYKILHRSSLAPPTHSTPNLQTEIIQVDLLSPMPPTAPRSAPISENADGIRIA
jgi:hypothetical protein